MSRKLIVCPACKGERIVLVPTPDKPRDNWVACGRCDAEGVVRLKEGEEPA